MPQPHQDVSIGITWSKCRSFLKKVKVMLRGYLRAKENRRYSFELASKIHPLSIQICLARPAPSLTSSIRFSISDPQISGFLSCVSFWRFHRGFIIIMLREKGDSQPSYRVVGKPQIETSPLNFSESPRIVRLLIVNDFRT